MPPLDFDPLPQVHWEGNPLSLRLNNIRDIQLRIDRCRKEFVQRQQAFQVRLEDLSSQIRKPIYVPWMGKWVELKKAMGFIKERHEKLTKSPMMVGGVDLKVEEVCQLRDQILKPVSKLNETYQELDGCEEAQRTEMGALLRERESLIEEYLEFSFRNERIVRQKISPEAYSEIQSNYDFYVAPYIGHSKKRIEEKVRKELASKLHTITKYLSFCLYGLFEIKEWCDKLLESEAKKIEIPDGKGGFIKRSLDTAQEIYEKGLHRALTVPNSKYGDALRKKLEPIRSAIVKADDRSKILATIHRLELENNAEGILESVEHQMKEIHQRCAHMSVNEESSISELFRYVAHLINSIQKCRNEIVAVKEFTKVKLQCN